MPEITPLTPARVAIVDPATGGVTRPWYMFFQSLYQSAQNAVLNYIGAAPPSDGQLLCYDAAGQGWTNSVGLTVNATGGITATDYISVEANGSGAYMSLNGDKNGAFLYLTSTDSFDLAQIFYDDNTLSISAPSLAISSNDVSINSGGDVQIGVSNVYTFLLSGTTGFLSLGVGSPPTPTAQLDISNNTIRLRNNRTPASATASGNKGDICWDTSYIYVCVATNTWKRTAISTW